MPGRHVRALIFKAAGVGKGRALRPLHVNFHSGAFMGGLPEGHAYFDQRVSEQTGAVVLDVDYRVAPEHVFPAAIDDADATIKWLQENAEERWGADPTLMTTSGFSAGGNLAFAVTQQKSCQAPSPTAIKAITTFYAAIDMRLSPWEKPHPDKMPKNDPAKLFLPLFDAYAAPARAKHFEDPRLSPVLARVETLPERMLVVVPGIDILVAEQTEFAERINQEDGRRELERVGILHEEDLFHGYLEVPDIVVKREVKHRVYDKAIQVLRETHEKYGWIWNA
ncbi:triacylglycerol lipase [Fusarium beomiforme]|uniref:Triacylglycerol lipase n=1 Tax=Fusarium beomiforme TaxID=44412 RepID=A0A9P5E3K6_9HYPO|nr:triacylglycerol lipase [Fusarium beomiforme]